MKKTSILISLFMVISVVAITSCNSQTTTDESAQSSQSITLDENLITIYYYHGDRRCATCKAVGRVSKQAIAETFGENKKIVFKDINIDDPANNEIKEKLELSGSGLIVYSEDKTEDLTVFAFQKAVASPEELSNKLISTVKEML